MKPQTTQRRQRAYKMGHIAEMVALVFLWLKGYRVVARRCATPVGEIDLLVHRGQTYVAVEVKYRATLGQGWEAVTPQQKRRVQRALLLYCAQKTFIDKNITYRCDVVVVTPWGWPHHILNAWWIAL